MIKKHEVPMIVVGTDSVAIYFNEDEEPVIYTAEKLEVQIEIPPKVILKEWSQFNQFQETLP